MNPRTWYIPEGESHHLTVTGVRTGNEEAEVFYFVDGRSTQALYLLCEVDEADSDEPLLLKQFGAVDLMAAGLQPTALEPGDRVRVRRYEGGGFEVENEPDGVEDASDAM